MTSEQLVVRPFRDEDLPAVLDLLRLSLGETPTRPKTQAWFEWKHFRNPFGRSLLLVAELERQIVGLRALMRWELATPGGDRIRCARPVDTATHPDFRRLGIFRRLTLAAISEARQQGVELLFNTPNPGSGGGYLAMGWRQVGTVGVMIRPKVGLLGGSQQALTPEEMMAGAEDGVNLKITDRAPLGLRTHRNAEYVAWRFEGNPGVRYFWTGVGEDIAVVRPNLRGGRRELVISDLFGHAAPALRQLARRSCAQYLVGWFSPGTPERRVAIRGGLIPVPGVRALTLVARPLVDLDFDVLRFSNWDLALSDLELL